MSAVVVDGGRWESEPLQRAGDAAAVWAAERLAERFSDVDGLYVASGDAGAAESVAFWRGGLDTGLAFANPGPFPWTLANSPTGRIGQQLGVRGPTVTLIGSAEALAAALEDAADDLAAGRVTSALVVALDGTGDGRVMLAAVFLRPGEAATSWSEVPDGTGAAEALGELLDRLCAADTHAESDDLVVRDTGCTQPTGYRRTLGLSEQ